MSKPEQVEAMVQAAVRQYGRIDVLVNSAGVFIRNSIVEASPEEWTATIALNLLGYVSACRFAIPEMLTRSGGKIVNISSIHGLVGAPAAATYCATKGAIENLTKQLAVDYGARGVSPDEGPRS